jgi:hypothetical protein
MKCPIQQDVKVVVWVFMHTCCFHDLRMAPLQLVVALSPPLPQSRLLHKPGPVLSSCHPEVPSQYCRCLQGRSHGPRVTLRDPSSESTAPSAGETGTLTLHLLGEAAGRCVPPCDQACKTAGRRVLGLKVATNGSMLQLKWCSGSLLCEFTGKHEGSAQHGSLFVLGYCRQDSRKYQSDEGLRVVVF